jgi:NAD+ kinase
VKTIGFIARPDKPEAVTLAGALAAGFPHRTFLAEPHLAGPLGWVSTPDTAIAERSELLVVLGGDGTLIHAARVLRGREVPLLGINLGSLGFMTEVPSRDAARLLQATLDGKAIISSRLKLRCRILREGKAIFEDEALNDVVLNKGAEAKIVDFDTLLEDKLIAHYKSDGLIFATPTGSTAYSLSAGGPIVHPSIDCVIVTPICPHALTQKPIVVPGDRPLRVALKSQVTDVYLSVDGQPGVLLKVGDRIEVERASTRLLLVQNPDLDYFSILREKLHWGTR